MLKLSCMCECLGVQITRENQRASLFQTLGFFICYWELPSYYIHTQDHTNPFRYILHYHLESWLNYSGVSWSCHSCECLEVQFTRANKKRVSYLQPWFQAFFLAFGRYPHTTSTHHMIPIPSFQLHLHYHLEAKVTYSRERWDCPSCACLGVPVTIANQRAFYCKPSR